MTSGVYFRQDLLPAAIGAGFAREWDSNDPFTEGLEQPDASLSTLPGLGIAIRNLTGAVLVTAKWAQFRLDPSA